MRNVTIWHKIWAIILMATSLTTMFVHIPFITGWTAGAAFVFGVWILCARTIVWESEWRHD